MSRLDREQWSTLLDRAEPATFFEVVDEVAEVVDGDAEEVVEAAIADGPLDEADTGGAYNVLRLAEADDTGEKYLADSETADPLDEYEYNGYVREADTEAEEVARDAAVTFTASNMGPPFATDIDDAGDWWQPGYDAACVAVEEEIVDALLDDTDEPTNENSETPNSANSTDEEGGSPRSPDANPRGETGDTAEQNGVEREEGVARVGETLYPLSIAEREYWVTWILDGVGRKRPVAPWQTGHAYPVQWSGDLDGDDRPEVDFDTASRWVDFSLAELGLSLPDDAQSEELQLGLILPNERAAREDRITLIDWDDVRDPDTGEIHPVADEYISKYGGYVEVSTSGEGLHQFVRGGLRKRGKFIAPIDSEPFVGEDLPQVEIYDGGRHVAMTGRHVEGTDEDVVDAQPCIDEIITEYAEAEQDAGYRAYDPETGEYDGESGDSESTVPEPKTGEYGGPSLDDLRETKPEDRSLAYHAVVEAFYRGGGNSGGFAHIQNWRLEGFAAALGERDDLDPSEIKKDLAGRYLDDTDVEQRCRHETPHRIDYGHKRAAKGRLEAPSWSTLVRYGVLPAEAIDGGEEGDESEEYRRDPRELSATVDMRRAWQAASRVTPDDLDSALDLETTDDGEAWLAPNGERVGDVARAVALDTDLLDTADDQLDDYPLAYNRAREEYGAPLPRYYTTSDAIAEFDAVLDVIGEVTFWDLDTDALNTEITGEGDEVDGEAVRSLNPAWRDSESGESVIVFESGTVWDADSERVLDALRFCALDAGIIDEPGEPLENSKFTDAYTAARTTYGAPLPRWEPAEDGAREITPQLPPSEELVDAFDYDGVDESELDVAREEVEELIGERLDESETPTVVTSLPATGKTTGTIKNARERPLSYLAPRKELQAQALDKAEKWDVDAEVLPVFSDERVRDEVLDAAVSHVRDRGKDRLRDRWAILGAAFDAIAESDDVEAGDLDPSDIFEESDDDVELDRPTCETASGEHGVAWALAVHIARRLGYTPREIHTEARGLFGAELPCSDGEAVECEYTEGWDRVTDADNCPDLLVGSYVHAHIESVRTAYDRGRNGDVERSTRGLVLDEFPGEAFVREFGGEAFDFATWLASSLRDDVEDRRDMYDADLAGDEWVRAWLDGEADDVVGDAIGTLARTKDLLDARRAGEEILDEVDRGVLESLRLADALDEVTNAERDAAEAFDDLEGAINSVDRNQPAAGIAAWADSAVREPLGRATAEGRGEPDLDAVEHDTLPSEGDLAELVGRAVEAVENTEDAALATVEAAVAALRGGAEGCRRLAAWADDGYAHPDAHHLLTAVTTPSGERGRAQRINTSSWAFDDDATEGTVLDVVETTDRDRVVADRNDHGALLHTPPERTNGAGEESPLIGLDATGRAELWSTSLGEEVRTADIHTTDEERARFLENALSLRVIRAADTPRPYEGDPTSKDTDGDVALLERIAEEYSGIQAPRQRGEEAVEIGKPAAITTKGVRSVLESDRRLDDVVAAWENYGNVTGANDLGDHRLAAILGSQHYGDDAIERFCALAGEEADTSRDRGRGSRLDYGNDLANIYHKHMSEDQTMQAILRFTRGDSGATVVARTSALRPDLPVVGEGQVVETWNETATTIAREYRRLGGEFTAADVRDAVDVTPRQVRRVLDELVRAGYLRRDRRGEGLANVYEPAASTPGAGEVELPERGDAVKTDAEPGQRSTNQYYTWNVRVFGGDSGLVEHPATAPPAELGAPPSPEVADASQPPG